MPPLLGGGAGGCSAIESFPVAALVHAATPEQSLIKQWRVLNASPSKEGMALPMRAIQLAIAVPTVLFVHRDDDPPQADALVVARVEFSGNCEQTLNAINVDTDPSNNTLLRMGLAPKTNAEGYLMGEIFLGPGAVLTGVALRGETQVVIQDEYVFPDYTVPCCCHGTTAASDAACVRADPFAVDIQGDATLLVSMPQRFRRLRFHALQVHTTGDGVVFFDVPMLQIDSQLQVNTRGDGRVELRHKSLDVHGPVTIELTGDADLRIASSSLHVNHSLQLDTKGDAKVYLGAKQGRSRCPMAQIVATGDATIDLGALTCINTTVKARGDADVTVQVIDTLEVQAVGDAHVQYVVPGDSLAQAPRVVDTSRSKKHRCHVTPATNYIVVVDPTAHEHGIAHELPAHRPRRVDEASTGYEFSLGSFFSLKYNC